jgi:hypothetical protein
MFCFKLKTLAISAALALGAGIAQAGPVVIDGTDSGDHGSVTGTTNNLGWEYMQRVLTNLGTSVDSGVAKVVQVIGTDAGSQSRVSITSAFNQSGLIGAGWSINYVSDGAIAGFMSTLSTANTGILYLSTSGNVGGDMSATELADVNAAAAKINTFVSGAGNPATGGALFTQGETGTGAYGWLSTLIPGILFTDVGAGGIATDITLTAAGTAAFPGLTNADIAGADPWHGYFSGNLGGLSVLGTALDGNNTRNLIIGGGAGTVISCGAVGAVPCPTPEPETLPLLAIGGLAMALATLRRRKTK